MNDRPRRPRNAGGGGAAMLWLALGGGGVILVLLGVVAFLLMSKGGAGDKSAEKGQNRETLQPRDADKGRGAARPGPNRPPRRSAPSDLSSGDRTTDRASGANAADGAGDGASESDRGAGLPPAPKLPNDGRSGSGDRTPSGRERSRGGATASGETSEQPADFNLGSGGAGEGDGSAVFPYVLKSAVLIFVVTADGKHMAQGSGALIDKNRRLVLTNHHVAGDAREIVAFFPMYDREGKLIASKDRFAEQAERRSGGVEAKLLITDKRRDLAIVQLARLPAGVEGLPLASEPPRVGQRVHSVGSPARSGALWVYAPGVVRQVYHSKWRVRDEQGIMELEADIIETQSPTNHGDSGGPMVNDRGELIGVTQGGNDSGQNSIFIQVAEVRRLVDRLSREKFGGALALGARAPMAGGGRRVAAASLTDLVRALQSDDAKARTKAAEALGQVGEGAKDAIPALVKLLADPDDFTRRTAYSSLMRIGPPPKADVALLAEALGGALPEQRRYAAAMLEKLGPDGRAAGGRLVAALRDPDAQTRQAAARAVGKLGAEQKDAAMPALEEMLRDGDAECRQAAAQGLTGILAAANDVYALRKLLKHQDPAVREAVAKLLAALGRNAKPYLPELLELAKSDTGELRRSVLGVVASVDPADAKPGAAFVAEALKASDKETKLAALPAAVNLGKELPPAAIASLRALLRDEELKLQAIAALAKLGPHHKPAVAALGDALKDPDSAAQEAAMDAIAALGSSAAGAGLVNELIKLMDIEGNRVTAADKDRVTKAANLVAKIGKAAIPNLRNEVKSGRITRWGAAIALGNLGPAAREALRDLQLLAQVEPNDFIRIDVEDAIRKIGGR